MSADKYTSTFSRQMKAIVYIFFKVIVKLEVDAGRLVGRFTKRLGTKADFASKPVCIQRKKEKDKKNSGMRITKGYLWRES